MKTLSTLLFLLVLSIPVYGQETKKLTGDWEGHIEVQGQQLVIQTHFQSEGDSYSGTIDIPQQVAAGIPLREIQVTPEDSVFFEFQAAPGNIASFKGIFTDDSLITGTYYQSSRQFPFELKRIESEEKVETSNTPTPLTYNSEELVIQHDSIAIGGTLTWPKDESSDNLVIMLSGSGAQDRDERLPGVTSFKPFAELADSLTTHGIATFRYDDRGVGQSTGTFVDATLSMLASDVDAIIAEFTGGSKYTYENIILLGHSLGGIVGAKVAAQNEQVDKLILMASPGIPLNETLRFQIRKAFAPANLDSALVDKEISAREDLMHAIVEGKNLEPFQETYHEIFKTVQIAAGMDTTRAEGAANRQVQQLTATFETPQLKSLLFYDPAQELKQLDIPVLVLFGGKDSQVPVSLNKEPIEEALQAAGAPYQIEILDSANHLFQKAETGQVQEYATLDSHFVNGFISLLEEWIKE